MYVAALARHGRYKSTNTTIADNDKGAGFTGCVGLKPDLHLVVDLSLATDLYFVGVAHG